MAKLLKESNRFKYCGVPDEVLSAVKAALEPWENYLPLWCQSCRVDWCADGQDETLQENASMACVSAYEYRRIVISVYPQFLESDTETRLRLALHEIIHGTVNVLHDFAWCEIKRLVEEGPHREALLAELNNRVESVTQDLTYIIMQDSHS